MHVSDILTFSVPLQVQLARFHIINLKNTLVDNVWSLLTVSSFQITFNSYHYNKMTCNKKNYIDKINIKENSCLRLICFKILSVTVNFVWSLCYSVLTSNCLIRILVSLFPYSIPIRQYSR